MVGGLNATVQVDGLADLSRALGKVNRDAARTVRAEIIEAAQPARPVAEGYAISRISNMTGPWSRMRIGMTVNGVYLAPASRRSRGSPRPNLSPLLRKKSMEPAVERESPRIHKRVDEALQRLGESAGFDG